ANQALRVYEWFRGKPEVKNISFHPLLFGVRAQPVTEFSLSLEHMIAATLAGPLINLIVAGASFLLFADRQSALVTFFININLFTFLSSLFFMNDGRQFRDLQNARRLISEAKKVYPEIRSVLGVKVNSVEQCFLLAESGVYSIRKEREEVSSIKGVLFHASSLLKNLRIPFKVDLTLIKNEKGESHFTFSGNEYALYKVENFPEPLLGLPPRNAEFGSFLREILAKARPRSEMRGTEISRMSEEEVIRSLRRVFGDLREPAQSGDPAEMAAAIQRVKLKMAELEGRLRILSPETADEKIGSAYLFAFPDLLYDLRHLENKGRMLSAVHRMAMRVSLTPQMQRRLPPAPAESVPLGMAARSAGDVGSAAALFHDFENQLETKVRRLVPEQNAKMGGIIADTDGRVSKTPRMLRDELKRID
ncbi:MAG: hypothetical protein WC352_06240, partial [Candidatus Omnitrophota bacterium]